MPTTTDTNSRTARLLALMKKGDDAFNARDFATVDEVHHPDMIAYITGLAEPVYGKEAHAAAMQQMLRIFPDMHVYSDPYAIQFGSGDWITVVTNSTGTFTGEMTLPDGSVIPPTGKAFDLEFAADQQVEGRPAHRHLRLLGHRATGKATRTPSSTRGTGKEAAVNRTAPAATVLDEVATWAGITTQPTPRGATAILFEGHELGHVHANRSTLDLP